MTEIKRLSLVLSVLHVVGAVFALIVFAITAASIAEANRAASAVNNSVNDLTGALSSINWNLNRKLLATSTYGISFGSFLNFIMFVSISGMLLSGFLALFYFKRNIYDKTLGALAVKSPAWAKFPFYELVIAAVWCIFWLAAAGAASDSPFVKIISYCTGVSACNQINAVVAFSWLSWLIWLAIVVLLAVEYGLAARKTRKAIAPAGPAGTTAAVAHAPAEAKKDVEAPAPAPAPAAAHTPSKDVAAAPAVEPAAPETVVVPGAVEEKPKEGATEVELTSHP